jgi:hypothetical protein
LLAPGAAIAIVISLWAAKFVSSLLCHIDARDPPRAARRGSIPRSRRAGSEPERRVSRRRGVSGRSVHLANGVDPRRPIKFDLTRDQPDNITRDGAATAALQS